MPVALALAGGVGVTSPSQAFETAQVSESAESTVLESTVLESTVVEPTIVEPTVLDSSGAEDDSSDQTTADGAATAPDQKSAPLTLERPNQDPLLPGKANGRALTSPEQDRLRLGLKRLNLEAETAYGRGDRSAAYRKYFRILSLSQYLPAQEELGSLTRVGRIAWQDSMGEEAQVIAARVRQLETDAGEKISPTQQQSLAEAYESLGAWDRAIAHYETLLALEQPNGAKGSAETHADAERIDIGPTSPLDEGTLVNRLAQLNLFSLNYPAATLYIEQALLLADLAAPPSLPNREQSNLEQSDLEQSGTGPAGQALQTTVLPLPSETAPAQTPTELLTQLAYVYEQDQKFAEAAAVQQRIFPLYADPLFVSQQPALQLAIAHNQARSGQLVEAIASYQTAYRQSQTFQQFDVSHNALSQLAMLYRSQDQLDDALSVYDVLLQVNDLSYNLYGIADTQASRAEILLEQQQIAQARQAYRQALHAAKLLGYREAEFQQNLDALPSP